MLSRRIKIEVVAVTECSEPLIHVTLTPMALASIAAAAAAYIAMWPTHKVNEANTGGYMMLTIHSNVQWQQQYIKKNEIDENDTWCGGGTESRERERERVR